MASSQDMSLQFLDGDLQRLFRNFFKKLTPANVSRQYIGTAKTPTGVKA
jgi:hypothetical protein